MRRWLLDSGGKGTAAGTVVGMGMVLVAKARGGGIEDAFIRKE